MSPLRRRMRSSPAVGEGVRVLTPADLDRVRADRHPRLRPGDAAALIVQSPGLSFWHPESDEFVLVTPWRHRHEIPSVHLLSAFYHEDLLLSSAVRAADERGAMAFVVMDAQESRRPDFYERNRLRELERIVTYEHRSPADVARTEDPALAWVPVHVLDPTSLDALYVVDHAAFPWLWQNSAEEFRAYHMMPFVEIWLGFFGDQPVAYVGMTHFRGWSHLDRIAVHPAWQGRGLGRASLAFAARRMVESGARKMALSTQASNTMSRSMYTSAGFVETPSMNYAVHGVVFDRAAHKFASRRNTDV